MGSIAKKEIRTFRTKKQIQLDLYTAAFAITDYTHSTFPFSNTIRSCIIFTIYQFVFRLLEQFIIHVQRVTVREHYILLIIIAIKMMMMNNNKMLETKWRGRQEDIKMNERFSKKLFRHMQTIRFYEFIKKYQDINVSIFRFCSFKVFTFTNQMSRYVLQTNQVIN